MTYSSNPLQIVDITNIDQSTASELLNAATTQGFLFVEGHDFTEEEVQKLFKLAKEFFELPESYKSKYNIDDSNHGYTNYGGENLDPSSSKKGDPKEAFNFSAVDFVSGLSKKELPDWFYEKDERRELVQLSMIKLFNLSIKILKILALALKIEDNEIESGIDWFTSRYQPNLESGSTLRLLHYPGQKSLNPEATIRAGAHTDYGSMTLLFQQQNQEGLEIYSPVHKKWQPVPYVSNNNEKHIGKAAPIVVNIADQLSYWTGGLLKSTIHRVKFPEHVQKSGQDRYSIVFFSHPNDDTLLEPVPSELVRSIKNRGANSAKTHLTSKQHLNKRLAATYAWSY